MVLRLARTDTKCLPDVLRVRLDLKFPATWVLQPLQRENRTSEEDHVAGTSKGRIGVRNQDKTAEWRDDELGHPEFGAGPHVNAWNGEKGIFDNLHLDY